jgi:hypothetical protein
MQRKHRWAPCLSFVLATAITLASLGVAVAQTADPAGAWRGTYTCAQGLTALDMTIDQPTPGRLRALFHFTAVPSNPDVPEGCFLMTGTFDPASRQVTLRPDRWLLQPSGYVMVEMNGRLDDAGQVLAGQVSPVAGCTTFALFRVAMPPARSASCRPDATVAW